MLVLTIYLKSVFFKREKVLEVVTWVVSLFLVMFFTIFLWRQEGGGFVNSMSHRVSRSINNFPACQLGVLLVVKNTRIFQTYILGYLFPSGSLWGRCKWYSPAAKITIDLIESPFKLYFRLIRLISRKLSISSHHLRHFQPLPRFLRQNIILRGTIRHQLISEI